MQQFLIFFSRSNDALRTVNTMHSIAAGAARQSGQLVLVGEVDIDVASADAKKFWSGSNTIECVTVKDDTARERSVNPGRDRIIEMVNNLNI